MKIVFLDVDGVLNAIEDYRSKDYRPKKNAAWMTTSIGEKYHGISQRRVARLARIISEAGAKIVLSSSWKESYEYYVNKGDDMHIGRYLVNALSRKGLHIMDTTYRFENSSMMGSYYRGDAIRKWIEWWDGENPNDKVEKFVILDDDPFDFEEAGLTDHWVETDYYGYPGGLTDEKADLAIKILKGETHEK